MNEPKPLVVAIDGGFSMADYARELGKIPAVFKAEADRMVARLQASYEAAEREAQKALLVDTPLPAPERIAGPPGRLFRVHPSGLNRKTRRKYERELASARKRVRRLEQMLGYRP